MSVPIPRDDEVQDLATIPIKNLEAKHQAALVAVLRKHWSDIPTADRPIVFHVPNGGSRNALEATNLKVQGVLAGVPDLCLVLPRARVLWIEMKEPGGGFTSKWQKALHKDFAALGHTTITAFSVHDALAQLRDFFKCTI